MTPRLSPRHTGRFYFPRALGKPAGYAGSIPVSRTKENPLALRLRGFVFNFLVSLFAEGWCSSADLCLFWRRCSVYFLRAVAGNPPSLRFGHPEGASGKYARPAPCPRCHDGGHHPSARRKNTRPRFSKGRACVRDTGITNWKGRRLSPSQSFAGSAGSTFVGRASYTLPPRRRREPALASLRAP